MAPAKAITNRSDAAWRSIILFGRNVASYKFALAKSLIELSDQEKNFVTLDELAVPFSAAICEHLKLSDKQATSQSSRFLDACRAFNKGEIGEDQLVTETVQRGFNNVIDAFHVVNQGEIPLRFYVDDRASKGGITLTDDIHRLGETFQWRSFGNEVEARWRLVETAWDLGVSRNMIAITPDPEADRLLANFSGRRVDVTSSRDALNGYQKGLCFYCFDEISVLPGDGRLGDVDHFIPWILEQQRIVGGLNGIWNLVLACRECNRGAGGKFALVPSERLLARLEARNNYLIQSHHPLRETLILQTGNSAVTRRSFLRSRHREALDYLHHTWEPQPRGPGVF